LVRAFKRYAVGSNESGRYGVENGSMTNPMSKSNPSRADRFQEAIEKIGEGQSEIEEIRDELQNWLDNLPENLQNGMKAEALQSAIDECETAISGCGEAAGASPEFPGMFG
jgi:hypothetical protein